MKSKIHYKISPGKSISLLALLLFTNSLLFAQLDKKEEKGSKHIKIEAEVDGKMINVDTIIPAGADFDHAAFMESLGLEGEMESDENGFTYEYETEDGKTLKKKGMRKEVRVEVEADGDGDEHVTKTVIIRDGDESERHRVIKRKINDGDEEMIIIKNGEVIEGDAKIIKKEMNGGNVIIIEEESEDGSVSKTKVRIDEEGTKHEIEDGENKVIIFKEKGKDGKTKTEKIWIDEDGKKHLIKESDNVIIIKEKGEKKEKKKKKNN